MDAAGLVRVDEKLESFVGEVFSPLVRKDRRALWHVERSFRMSKSDLAARPIFHHLHESIEAHLTIVFTALAVAHTIQNKTGLAIANVIKQLRPLRSATIAINGTHQTFPPQIPNSQAKILTHPGIANGVLKMT